MKTRYEHPASWMRILAETSRTFLIPISRLVPSLQEAVASAYLCMRAIDEIEDHPSLKADIKSSLLRSIQADLTNQNVWNPAIDLYALGLPEVTLRLNEWLALCPPAIADLVRNATAKMARDMAHWAERNWHIQTQDDLDEYSFAVAGVVGLLLTDIWKWYDQTITDRTKAINFGRGLQAVNIIRNREEDLQRGVDFFPVGWNQNDMIGYARSNLLLANAYMDDLKAGPIAEFCSIPLALAWATLDAITSGSHKLERAKVLSIVKEITG